MAGIILDMWKDVVVATPTDVTLNLPLVWVGTGSDAELQNVDLSGKAVAASLVAPPNPPNRNVSLASWRYATGAVRVQSMRLLARGAAAVVLVADSLRDGGTTAAAGSGLQARAVIGAAIGQRRTQERPRWSLARFPAPAPVTSRPR
ncbi:MAG: hypothetical protein ACT4P7_18730 [Gemmatimonadaceae bacterium]